MRAVQAEPQASVAGVHQLAVRRDVSGKSLKPQSGHRLGPPVRTQGLVAGRCPGLFPRRRFFRRFRRGRGSHRLRFRFRLRLFGFRGLRAHALGGRASRPPRRRDRREGNAFTPGRYLHICRRFGPKRQHAQQGHLQPQARIRRKGQLAAPLYRNFVEQLNLVGGERVSQRRKHFGLVILIQNAFTHGLQQRQPLQGRRHFREDVGRIGEPLAQFPGAGQQGIPVAARKRVEQVHDAGLIGAAQHVGHVGFAHRVGPVGDGLVQQAQRVAHAAVGGPGQPGKRPRLGLHSLALADGRELIADRLAVHGPQVDLQAA